MVFPIDAQDARRAALGDGYAAEEFNTIGLDKWVLKLANGDHRRRPADLVFFDQVEADALEREDFQQATRANSIDNFMLLFDKELERLIVDRVEGNEKTFRRVMQDEQVRAVASARCQHAINQAAGYGSNMHLCLGAKGSQKVR